MKITRPVIVLATKHAHMHKFFENSVSMYTELAGLIEFVIIGFEVATDDQVMALLRVARVNGLFNHPALYMIGTTENPTSAEYDLLDGIPLKQIFPANPKALLDEIIALTAQILAFRASGGWQNPDADD